MNLSKVNGFFKGSNTSMSSNNASNNTIFKKINKNNTLRKVVLIILAILFTILVLFIIKKIILYFYDKNVDAPYLIKGTRNGRNALVINQNPKDENAITLYRSSNQKEGLEFSYTLWLSFNDFKYKYGEHKVIFYKGNKTGYPNRAPGVFLHPIKNTLLIYMNTYDNILTQIDIDDIPIKKWIHLGIIVTQKYMDIYFNGKLKKRHGFQSIPKQNFGNVWINMNGGFDGYISKFRYYRYALAPSSIDDIFRKGPSKKLCEDTEETPPYLGNDWWLGINN
jgi:hypothetical protein